MDAMDAMDTVKINFWRERGTTFSLRLKSGCP